MVIYGYFLPYVHIKRFTENNFSFFPLTTYDTKKKHIMQCQNEMNQTKKR